MRYIFLSCIGFFSLLMSCSQMNYKTKSIPCVQLKTENETDSSFYYYRQLSSTFYSSIFGNHRSLSTIEEEDVYLHLNTSYDSLYIIYSKQKRVELVAIPFEKTMPVSNLYYHNDDSIFVFYERDAIVLFREHGFDSDDFIMMDAQGKRKDSYSLDEVPYIFNGQLNPMIYMSALVYNIRMISNGVLYIPFSIYQPNTHDPDFKDLDISLLCAYDLKKKQTKMLHVKFPIHDVGKEYPKGVFAKSIDFFIKDSNTIIYTFLHSSHIYELTISSNSSKQIASFDDFFLKNHPLGSGDSSIRADFYAPVFSPVERVFVRKIHVREYKNFKTFIVSQILDEKMKLIGYSFGEGNWSNIMINRDGRLVVRNIMDGYLSHYCTISGVSQLKAEDIETQFLENKPEMRKKTQNAQIANTPFQERMFMYLDVLDLKETSAVVLISTDTVCGYHIDFLMKQMQGNVDRFENQKISYVFWGEDVSGMAMMLNSYRLDLSMVSLDFEGKYSEFFLPKELGQYSFVVNDGDNIHFHKSDALNLVQDFEGYIGFKKE